MLGVIYFHIKQSRVSHQSITTNSQIKYNILFMGNTQSTQEGQQPQMQKPQEYFEEDRELLKKLQLGELLGERFKDGWEPREPSGLRLENEPILNQKYRKGKPITDYKSGMVGSNPNLEVSFDQSKRKPVLAQKLKQLPYCAIGFLHIIFHDKHNPSVGSAVLIGDNLALTCAHNAYSRKRNMEAQKMTFIVGLNEGRGETYQVKDKIYPTQFRSGGYNGSYDYAILILEGNPGKTHGYLGMSFQDDLSKEMLIVGVPHLANGKQNVNRNLYEAKGQGFLSQNQKQPNIIFHKITTSGGQSGGPVLKMKNGKFYIIAIHLGQTQDMTSNFARYLDRQLQLEYRGLVFDQVMNLDFTPMTPQLMSTLRRESFNNLHKLQLRCSLKNLNQQGIGNLVKRLTTMNQLKELGLGENQIKRLDVSQLPQSLVILKVDGNHLNDQFVANMNSRNWPSLKSLFIGTNELEKADFNFMRFPALQKLDLSTNPLDSECLKRLGQQAPPNLLELDLSDNSMFQKSVANLKNCSFPNLSTLTLNKTNITAKAFQELRKVSMPLLRTLGLANNKIGKSLLQQLGKSKILEQIVVLDLSDNKFNELITILASLDLPNIGSLRLNLNEQGLQKLQDKELQKLSGASFFPNLGNLSMQSSNITVQALRKALEKGESLKCVSVEYNDRIARFDPDSFPDKKIYFDEDANEATDSQASSLSIND